MIEDDDKDELEEAEEPGGGGLGLAHWLEDHYLGDGRFDSVEVLEPGPLDGEDVRLCLNVDETSHFFVAVLPEESVVRVGLATDNRWASESIEQAVLDSGDSMTEFLEEAMEAGDELEHEMQHFHDDVFYFCSDIPFDTTAQLESESMRDEVIFYLDGYIDALMDYLAEEE